MPQEMVPGYCKNCRANKLFVQNVEYPNHALHFLFTILLCGCWAWVWLIVTLNGPKRFAPLCSECGLQLGFDPEGYQRDEWQEKLLAANMAQKKAEAKERRREAQSKRSAVWGARKDRFNAWISSLEPEQRFAMIAAPGFVMLVVGGLGLALWAFYR